MRYNTLLVSFVAGNESSYDALKTLARVLRTHDKGINAFMQDNMEKLEDKAMATTLRQLLSSYKLNSSQKAGLAFDAACDNADGAADIAAELIDDTKAELFKIARIKNRDNFIKCGELAAYIKVCQNIVAAAGGIKAAVTRLNESLAAVA